MGIPSEPRTVAIPARTVLFYSIVLICFLAVPQQLAAMEAQQPGVVVQSPDGYTRISSVRELRSGNLIVVDSDDRLVYLLDPQLRQLKKIGRHGAGPGEYQYPTTVVPLRGDTSGIIDATQGRILIVTPEGEAGGFAGLSGRTLGPIRGRSEATAADTRGFLYARGQLVTRTASGTTSLVDSVAVERWRFEEDTRDTIAYVPAELPAGSRLVAGMLRTPEPPPFRARTDWAIAEDGTLAIVRPRPYSVEFVRPDLRRVLVGSMTYEPIRLTEGHKHEWRAEQSRPRPMLVVARRGANQARSAVRTGTPPVAEPSEWPETLPPFVPGASLFSPSGELWVRRTTTAGANPAFDVFSQRGELVRRVTLPAGTRLVGFGEGTVYVVRQDENDLEYLQRLDFR